MLISSRLCCHVMLGGSWDGDAWDDWTSSSKGKRPKLSLRRRSESREVVVIIAQCYLSFSTKLRHVVKYDEAGPRSARVKLQYTLNRKQASKPPPPLSPNKSAPQHNNDDDTSAA